MATSPRIVASNVVLPASRVPAFSATAKNDLMPIEEIDQYSAVSSKEEPYYYEFLQNDNKQETNPQTYLLETPTRRRTVSAPMISGTTEGFAQVFSSFISSGKTSNPSNKGPVALTSMANGIGRYEHISRIINYEITPRGENLNFSI